MESDHERDERVMGIVSAALEMQREERESHIRIACGEDRELYNEVVETLDWEQRMGNFLQTRVMSLEDFGHPFKPGDIVSERFEIVREIGEGAMGVVYEALDRKRRQRVAIKTAKTGFRRFLSPELENALKVRHPNVCLVNEIHTAQTKFGDIDFLTMELLEGETLSAHLAARGNFSAREAIEIARQLCSGTAEAHRMGVIHGDLKPSNVILANCANGTYRAVITDFGLSSETKESRALCGTPRYIAPEVWLGEKASKASDLYALGVILLEIAAGRLASGDLAEEFRECPAAISRNYSRLVEGCLSLKPQKRCEAFEKALRPDYWKEPVWTRRKILAAASGAAACAALGGIWLERNQIVNFRHPLPARRFVALLLWPPTADARAKALVSGVIDAIESELSRAESSDPNLFVISSHEAAAPGNETTLMVRVCQSLGANLALEASGISVGAHFQLLLKLLDASRNTLLRQAKVVCAMGEIASLGARAVRAAAKLLDVHLTGVRTGLLKPGTNSASAFSALQTGEEFIKRPNDEGLEKAIENYKAAIEADPRYAGAYAKLAVAYSRLYELNRDPGTLELVEGNAQKALLLQPNSVDAHLALSAVAEERGDQDKALAEIQRALAFDPTNSRTLLWQGELYARFNRWTEAERIYIRLRKERPNYWPAYNDLGYVLAEQGKYRKAIEAFQAATVVAPGSALAFTNVGELFLKVGNVAEAKNNFEKSLKLKPTDWAYSNLSEALRAEGKYREAIPLSLEAVKLRSANDQNWLGLADCYDAISGRQKEAREAYRRAAAEVEPQVQTDPSDASSSIRLSLYRAKCGSTSEATAMLKRAAQFGIADLDSELIRARTLEVLGRRKDALATLADCFQRGATPFEVSSVRDFAALRKDPEYAKTLESIAKKNGTL